MICYNLRNDEEQKFWCPDALRSFQIIFFLDVPVVSLTIIDCLQALIILDLWWLIVWLLDYQLSFVMVVDSVVTGLSA